MRATVEIASSAQRGKVFLSLDGPFYDPELDLSSIHIGIAVRDRMNDKIESEVVAFIEPESALILADALKSLAFAAIELRRNHGA